MESLLLYTHRLCIGITVSRFSVLLTSVLLIFHMHDLNRALLLKISFIFFVLELLSPLTVILCPKTTYASL